MKLSEAARIGFAKYPPTKATLFEYSDNDTICACFIGCAAAGAGLSEDVIEFYAKFGCSPMYLNIGVFVARAFYDTGNRDEKFFAAAVARYPFGLDMVVPDASVRTLAILMNDRAVPREEIAGLLEEFGY